MRTPSPPRSPTFALTAILLAIGLTLSASAAARPNVIFILCDDMGYGDFGPFFQQARKAATDRAQPWHLTPGLDSMAADGLQLRGHYCPAPVCAPSRASLLLGQHQGHANVRDNQFDKGLEANHTLGSVMQGAGYATACIGKWGLQGGLSGAEPNWAAWPGKRGFDFYHGYIRHNDGHAHYPKEDGKQIWEMTTDITSQLDKCYTTDLFTARAKKWIVDQHAATPAQPFFLYLAYDTPHAELQLPTGPYPAGGGLSGGLQWTGTAGAMITSATGAVNSYYHSDYASATWDHDKNPATAETAWPDVCKRYATDVRRIDDCLQDLTKTLVDLGIDDETLIVFTTDNGPSKESYLPENYDPDFFNSFGPFDGIKRDVWEGGIRVGAVVRWPGGIPGNRVSNLPCQFHDWLPTFAELAGVPAPAVADGTSLVPELTATGVQKLPQVYVEYYEGGTTPSYSDFLTSHRGRRRNQMQAIRIGGYMGVRYNIASHADNFEIYSVTTDPRQAMNLAASQTDLQQRMKDAVLRLRRPDSSSARPYDGELVPALTTGPVRQGLQRRVREGAQPWVPRLDDVSGLPVSDAVRPDASALPAGAGAVLFSGYIQAPADGDYTFTVQGNADTVLRIHAATVIDADFGHTAGQSVSGSIRLQAGRHAVRLYARPAGGTPALSVLWQVPEGAQVVVPDTAWSQDGSGGPNQPPVPAPDAIRTSLNTPAFLQPLGNDTDDSQPQPLSIVSLTPPASGTLTVSGDTLTYTPRTGFLGEDSATVTITDGEFTATSVITLSVGWTDGDYWFPFDECTGLTATEAGGLITGSLSGFVSAPPPWAAGKHGMALTFDGVDDVVSIDGFNGITGTAPRTCAAWIRVSGLGNASREIMAWGPNTSTNKWTFLVTNTGLLRLEVTGGFIVGTRNLNDGQWHHVACTFSNDGTPDVTDAILYVDGTRETISTSTAQTINTSGTSPVKIGSDVQSRFWSGLLDDVRILPRTLSASEVAALASASGQAAEAWRHRHFSGTAPAWDSDGDLDDLPLLLEYALGTSPGIVRTVPAITFSQAGGTLSGQIRRRTAAGSGLRYGFEISQDLLQWSGTGVVASAPVPDQADSCYEVAAFTVPGATAPLFARMRAALP